MADNIQQAINDATLLLRKQHSGVLSTISVSVTDYPFGSVTPFLLNGDGDMIIYASDIAQHSKNIRANNKVSVFIHDAANSDSQASARVTVIGNATADSVSDADQQRYFRLFPQAKDYQQTHDFRFYLITVVRVRYIGGFGEIYWLSEALWRQSFVNIDATEVGAIAHMHQDHSDALQAIAHSVCDAKLSDPPDPTSVQLLSIVHNGIHLKIHQNITFVPFPRPMVQPQDLRKAVVELTQHARAQLSE